MGHHLGRIVFYICSLIYMAIPAYPEPIHLVTEHYPPFTMRINDKTSGSPQDPVTGIAVEVVRELFSRAGLEYTIGIYPWARAYNMALTQENYGIFTTTRTPQREPLFKWVCPLSENNLVFFAKKKKNIKLESLEDARKYSIGGSPRNSTTMYLIDLGFSLDIAPSNAINIKKLDFGRIDLWATGKLLGSYIAKNEGVSDIEAVLNFKKTILCLALNKSIDNEIVDKLNSVLKTMIDDGTIEKLQAKYR